MTSSEFIGVFIKCAAIWLFFYAAQIVLQFSLTLPLLSQCVFHDNFPVFCVSVATVAIVLAFAFFIGRLGCAIAKTCKEASADAIPLTITAKELEALAFRVLGVYFIASNLSGFCRTFADFIIRKNAGTRIPWMSYCDIIYLVAILFFGLVLVASPTQWVEFLNKLRKIT